MKRQDRLTVRNTVAAHHQHDKPKASGWLGVVVAPLIGAAAGLATPVVTQAVTHSPATSCEQVVARYDTDLHHDPALLDALTAPGPDGVTQLDRDPDVRRCHITADELRHLLGG